MWICAQGLLRHAWLNSAERSSSPHEIQTDDAAYEHVGDNIALFHTVRPKFGLGTVGASNLALRRKYKSTDSASSAASHEGHNTYVARLL